MSIELTTIDSVTSRPASEAQPTDSESIGALGPSGPITEALPPVDQGKDAWLFLAAATWIEVLVYDPSRSPTIFPGVAWGWPYSIGALHNYWTTKLFPADTPNLGLLTTASTLMTGLMYLEAVVVGPLFARYPRQRKYLQAVGLVAGVLSLVGTAFATKPWHLLVTVGIVYPFAGLLYYPGPTLLLEWFSAKRGFASGILYAGTGAGGTVWPFIIQGLINRFGYRAALISIGVGFGVTGAVALAMIQPRVPIPPKGSASARQARRIDWTVFKRSSLYAFAGCILVSSFGNFVPSVFVPSFALDLNLSASDGTLLLAMMNAASVPGLLVFGYLSDRWPPRVLITVSCLGSALSCLLLWGFSTSIKTLSIFVIVFGALGLGFTGLWTMLIIIIAKDDPVLANLTFCMFAAVRGVGNIAAGPISNVLLENNKLAGAQGGYGVKNYGSLLLYTGLTLVAGSISGMMYRDTPKRPREGGHAS